MQSDETASGSTKSPKAPRLSLADAIDQVKKLYAEAKRTSIKREVAARALGYASLNGSALTNLATLIQYNLLDQGPGTVAVSQLALQILHPLNDQQRLESLRAAALAPKLFAEIKAGHHGVSESVLANHLTQGKYPHDVARKLAKIYYENSQLAKLDEAGNLTGKDAPDTNNNTEDESVGEGDKQSSESAPVNRKIRMLANYTIPLGASEATLTVKGPRLTSEDFDALRDFIEFAKKQFDRKPSRYVTVAGITYKAPKWWEDEDVKCFAARPPKFPPAEWKTSDVLMAGAEIFQIPDEYTP